MPAKQTLEEKQVVRAKRVYLREKAKKEEERKIKAGHREIIFGDYPDELV